MREKHPELENPLDYVTITPFQIYDQLLHNKEKLRAHEGLWIKNFDLINKGLNRRQENGMYNIWVLYKLCELFRNMRLYGL